MGAAGWLLVAIGALAGCAGPGGAEPLASTTLRFDRGPHGVLDVPLVSKDAGQDDRQRLAQLVQILCERGSAEGLVPYGAVCSLEEYFVGLGSEGAFGYNVFDGPMEGAHPARWLAAFRGIRDRPGVADVLITDIQLEPSEKGMVLDWPFAESALVFTTLPDPELAALFEDLRPSELMEPQARHLEGLRHIGFGEPEEGERIVVDPPPSLESETRVRIRER